MFCSVCKSEYRDGFTRCSDCKVSLQDALDLEPNGERPQVVFCPNCRTQYNDGSTRCSGCDRKLVDRLAPETPTPSEAKRVVCKVYSYGAGADVCLRLKSAGIAFEVAQKEYSRSGVSQITWEFAVSVGASHYEEAKRVLKMAVGADEELPPVDEAELRAAMELPAEDWPSPTDSERSARWNPQNWDKEEATREVWSGDDADVSSMIEMSLRENYIHSRTMRGVGREWKIGVLPEDEVRAREIVREIMEGIAPE
jgi:hypothetical protein